MKKNKILTEILVSLSVAMTQQAAAIDDLILLLNEDEPEKKISDPNKRRAKTNTPPADFVITDKMEAYAEKQYPNGLIDWRLETESFKSHEFKTKYSDWTKAWQNWLRSQYKYLVQDGKIEPVKKATAADKTQAKINKLKADISDCSDEAARLKVNIGHEVMVPNSDKLPAMRTRYSQVCKKGRDLVTKLKKLEGNSNG